MERADVRVRQLRDGLGLATESLEDGLRRDEVRRQHLHGKAALETEVADEKDDRETAGAKGTLDLVLIPERLLQPPGEIVGVERLRGGHSSSRSDEASRTSSPGTKK